MPSTVLLPPHGCWIRDAEPTWSSLGHSRLRFWPRSLHAPSHCFTSASDECFIRTASRGSRGVCVYVRGGASNSHSFSVGVAGELSRPHLG